MSSGKKKLKLNTKKLDEQTQKPLTQQDIHFNYLASFASLVGVLEAILIEIGDIRENMDKMGLKEGWLEQVDIEERENAGEDDSPEEFQNSKKPVDD